MTGYCAARLPLASSTPSRLGGILLSIISKKKKCSSGGEGSNEGQLSWRFDPKDSAGAKQKIGREKNKKRSRVLESRETFHHLVRHYTKQPHLPQRSRILIPQCFIFFEADSSHYFQNCDLRGCWILTAVSLSCWNWRSRLGNCGKNVINN